MRCGSGCGPSSFARAGAVIALTALVVTVIAVCAAPGPWLPPSADAHRAHRSRRFAHRRGGGHAVAAAAALQPRNRSKAFERRLPAQGGRIETYLELARRRERANPRPLIELLAEDALAVADQAPPETAVPLEAPVGSGRESRALRRARARGPAWRSERLGLGVRQPASVVRRDDTAREQIARGRSR